MDHHTNIICSWTWNGSWEAEGFVKNILEETYAVYQPLFGVSPQVTVKALSSKESIAERSGRNALLPDWVSAMCRENVIILLTAKNFEQSEENAMLLKHELAHVFTNQVLKSCPIIFYEGIAVILSGQIREITASFSKIATHEMPMWLEIDYETAYFYEKVGFITTYCIQQLGISKFIAYLVGEEWLALEELICGGVMVDY